MHDLPRVMASFAYSTGHVRFLDPSFTAFGSCTSTLPRQPTVFDQNLGVTLSDLKAASAQYCNENTAGEPELLCERDFLV